MKLKGFKKENSYQRARADMSFSVFDALSKIVGRTPEQLKNNMNYPTSQSQVYSQALPNFFPVASSNAQTSLLQNANYFPAVRTVDPNSGTSKPKSWLNSSFPIPLQVPQSLVNEQNTCASSSLESLRTSYNPASTSRCGWIYKKGTTPSAPETNSGALGSRAGPVGFLTQPKGIWYWDLDAAQKQIDRDTCGFVQRCEDINTVTGCAWNKQSSSAIPVNANRSVKYPNEPALNGFRENLVYEASSCPPPSSATTVGPDGTVIESPDVCSPMTDGRLSRDCIRQRVTASGCVQGGALYTALSESTNPNNYAQALESVPSYVTYQRLSSTPLMDSVVKTGQTTTAIALDNFKALYTATQNTNNRLLNAVARDLCVKKGEFDTYDFCADYTTNTTGPFILECLQKAWRAKGGLPSGRLYPTAQNKGSYDSKGTWGAVQTYIQDLANKTRSSDEKTQRQALRDFMGITREVVIPRQIGPIYGSEIYYFNRNKNEFTGRRIKTSAKGGSSLPYLNNNNTIPNSEDDLPNQTDMFEFYFVANLRPASDRRVNIAVRTDDGSYVSLNRPLTTTRRGQYTANANEFGVNWDQAPTNHTNPNCWDITQAGPNYVIGTFNEAYGQQVFNLTYKDCTGSSAFNPIPEKWVTLTQEIDAPMLSFEYQVQQNGDVIWKEFRLPMLFPSGPAGGAFKKEIDDEVGIALGNSGSITFSRLLNMQSWRTITIAFKILSGTDVGTKAVFSMGPNLSINMVNANSLQVKYGTRTMNVPGTLRGAQNTGDKTYLLVINQRSDFYNQLPNRLTVACATIDDWSAGRASMSTGSVVTHAEPSGRSLFPATDSAQIAIGGAQSAPIWVKWIHVFDQELTTDTASRDAKGAWIRAFMDS